MQLRNLEKLDEVWNGVSKYLRKKSLNLKFSVQSNNKAAAMKTSIRLATKLDEFNVL